MKILEIIPQLGRNGGGAERFVVDLCNKLSTDHKVTLLVFFNLDQNGFFAKEINSNVKVISLNKHAGIDLRLPFLLRKLIHKENPDIVHTHLRAITYCLFAFLKPSKIKFIHTVHNDAEKEADGGISKWCRRFAFRTKRVTPVTISEESQRSFIDSYGITPPMIYNGRPAYTDSQQYTTAKKELDELRQSVSSKIILNVARIQKQKNQIPLVKAVNNLSNKHQLDLVIVGNATTTDIIQQINNISTKHIHLIGSRTNPRDYMRAADAFCLSSIYEGMPITLIECFSVGAIPICTPVGGIVNMIDDGKNGILATGTSQEEIEAAILRFLNLTDEQRAEMKRNSLASFTKYDMTTCAKNYVHLMQSLLQ